MNTRLLPLLLLLATGALAQEPETVWFKVAPLAPQPDRHETYLVPISDPLVIADARVLATQGPGNGVGTIVNASLLPGSDGFNRDLDAPGQRLWDWHVVMVHGFSDSAIEVCDGWPGFIEEDPQAYVLNTGNAMCLWGYTIVEEIPAPGYGIHPGLSGAWYDPSRGGQGLLITVDKDLPLVFAGWFTYDAAGSGGLAGQRWYTAQGPYTAESALLELYITTNGRFDAPDPVSRTGPGEVGTLDLSFSDCNNGTATYQFKDGPGRSFPLLRLPQVPRC